MEQEASGLDDIASASLTTKEAVDAQEEEEIAQLKANQSKEKKDLTHSLTGLKKAAGQDKKKRKEVAESAAKQEAQLAQTHAAQLCSLEEKWAKAKLSSSKPLSLNEFHAVLDAECPEVATPKEGDNQQQQDADSALPPIKNRQKARKAKKEAALDAIRQEALASAASAPNMQLVELNALLAILTPLGLKIQNIKADGHCLYSAVADQLVKDPYASPISHPCLTPHQPIDYRAIRALTAYEMTQHPEEYLPFLTNDRTGDMLTQAEYEAYVADVKSSSTWGGQVELSALSAILHRPLHVYQMEGPIITLGSDATNPLRLSYHKHQFGLGAHYNSVIPTSSLSTE